MSYEGYEVYLCERGHRTDAPAMGYNEQPMKCSCTAKFKWWARVDQTNGYDENYPESFDPPMKSIGFDDVPQVDHRGNHYVLKHDRWEPIQARRWKGSRELRWSRV